MIRDEILALKGMQPFSVKNNDVLDIVDLDADDVETIDTDEEINDNTNEEIIDTDEEIAYINMLNKMISKANEFSLVRNMFAQNAKEIGKIFIEIEKGIMYDDEIYEDPWLKYNKLHNTNVLIDESFDKTWKLACDKNREINKKIDIDKYSEIDKYVDKYTDITNGKIDLLNNMGLILDKAVIEIQNKAYIVNDMKKEKNAGIKILKSMHKILDKILIKWMKIMSSTLKNDEFSKYDMKPDKNANEKARKGKKDKKKAGNGKNDNRLVICEDTRSNIIKDTRSNFIKDSKPEIKKDTKPDIKKDTKPDIKIGKKHH